MSAPTMSMKAVAMSTANFPGSPDFSDCTRLERERGTEGI
jgi:hypothetical protein